MFLGNLLRALSLITIFLIGFISTTILAFEFDEKAKKCLEAFAELKSFESTAYIIEESILLQQDDLNKKQPLLSRALVKNLEFLELHGNNWSSANWGYIVPSNDSIFINYNDSLLATLNDLSTATEAILKSKETEEINNLSLQLTLNTAQREAHKIINESIKLQEVVYRFYQDWSSQKAIFWVISSLLAILGLALIIALIVYPKERALLKTKKELAQLSKESTQLKDELEKIQRTNNEFTIQLKENQRLLKIANFSLNARTEELKQSKEDLQLYVKLIYYQLKQPVEGLRQLLSRAQEQNKTSSRATMQQSLELAFSRNALLKEDLNRLKQFGFELDKEYNFELVYLNQLIAEALASLKPKELVKLNIPADLPSVRAPLFTLRFIVIALLDNALYFNKSSSPEVSIKYTLNTNTHTLEIADNGAPITKENQNLLFSLDFTTKSSVNEKIKGIGLPMSKYLIERFGGSITFSSTNTGNNFTFSWPVKS